MRYAYTVTGSEDGVIGVFTSYTRAVKNARAYIREAADDKGDGDVAQMTHQTKWTTYYEGNGATARIDSFALNEDLPYA